MCGVSENFPSMGNCSALLGPRLRLVLTQFAHAASDLLLGVQMAGPRPGIVWWCSAVSQQCDISNSLPCAAG